MPLPSQALEIQRLIKAFEIQAAKFHNLRLSIHFLLRGAKVPNVRFAEQNHTIRLWQYYGPIGSDESRAQLGTDLESSDFKWGLWGAKVSSMAVVEGKTCDLFVRMAKRAASLFTDEEAITIGSRVLHEVMESERKLGMEGKPLSNTNSNLLAVWINYLLYHLSLTHPYGKHKLSIEPDPFTLSLLALERLRLEHEVGKVDRSSRKLSEVQFKVAMTFPGERRGYVSEVVDALRKPLGPDAVFYDFDYQAQLALPNLDTLLQGIYRKNSQLIVVFLCAEYSKKHWCGLEWRVVRDIIKSKEDERIMFVRFDDVPIEGFLSIDGYIDTRFHSPTKMATFIRQRLDELPVD